MYRSDGFDMSAAPIDPRILEEAADWLMRLHADSTNELERADCARWRDQDPEHARAWMRAELLMNKLGKLPSSLAMPALDRPTSPTRRAAIARLAMLLAAVPVAWIAWRTVESHGWRADHHTATGERRDIRLSDGTEVSLNTASSVDIRFDAAQRLIVLHAGEILVRTAPDTATIHRPLRVMTAQGRVEALGTRFSIRLEEERTHLAVFEGSVRVEPRDEKASSQIIRAGQQTVFTGNTIAPAVDARETDIAWTRGMLMADSRRLGDFLEELSRYREGFLRCDPAVAGIRVSGAFPIANTDQALAMLVSTYPVEARTRLGGYWVTIVPHQK